MNKPFTGFSTDRQKTVRVPEGFFEDVLPQITSVLEMKLTLYLFWRLSRASREGSTPRMVSHADLEADVSLRQALTPNKGPRPVEEALRDGLELAVGRGTVLQLWVREEPNDLSDGRAERWYLLNTRDNRSWVEALADGRIDVTQTPLVMGAGMSGPLSEAQNQGSGTGGDGVEPTPPPPVLPGDQDKRGSIQNPRSAIHNRRIRVIAERPNVYTLYEQNIGLLTPILAERLQDAESRYPMQWIEDAFREAVTNNKRSWRYIEKILERWAAEGKDSGKDRGPAARGLDPDKYTRGKYAFLFRPDEQP